MKTLEEIRNGISIQGHRVHIDGLADRIQREIDEFYLPRPLFDDGNPMQWGDRYLSEGRPLGSVLYDADGSISLYAEDGSGFDSDDPYILSDASEKVERTPGTDTQEQLDCSVKAFVDGLDESYDAKRNIEERIFAYLARQRDIDAVKES